MVYQLYDEQNRTKLLERVGLADDFRLRFLGLMGRSHLPKGEGLFLKKVGSVHTLSLIHIYRSICLCVRGRIARPM